MLNEKKCFHLCNPYKHAIFSFTTVNYETAVLYNKTVNCLDHVSQFWQPWNSSVNMLEVKVQTSILEC